MKGAFGTSSSLALLRLLSLHDNLCPVITHCTICLELNIYNDLQVLRSITFTKIGLIKLLIIIFSKHKLINSTGLEKSFCKT